MFNAHGDNVKRDKGSEKLKKNSYVNFARGKKNLSFFYYGQTIHMTGPD